MCDTKSIGETLGVAVFKDPETGFDLEQPPGGGQIPQLAGLITRRLGYYPGIITKEPLDPGTLNEAARAVDTSSGIVLFNGRSAVHAGSGGQVCTVDICESPSGDGCKPRTCSIEAKSTPIALMFFMGFSPCF